MQIYQQHALRNILEDFLFFLTKNRDQLVWKYPGEEEPSEADFSFHPVVSENTFEHYYQKGLCTLCRRRISYKKDQFKQHSSIKQHLLILVHNPFLGNTGRIYHEPEAESIFLSFLKEVWNETKESFLIREVLRCHFGAEEVHDKEWVQNCQTHIQDDIEKYSIQGIWALGEAAPLIFKEKDELLKRMDQPAFFMGVPMLITYGPSRLVYMKKKNYSQDKIQQVRSDILRKVYHFKDHLDSIL